MKRYIARILALFAVAPLAFACTNTPPAETVLEQAKCQARVVAPYIADTSDEKRLAKALVAMADSGELDVEQTLLDIGMTLDQLNEFRRAFAACKK